MQAIRIRHARTLAAVTGVAAALALAPLAPAAVASPGTGAAGASWAAAGSAPSTAWRQVSAGNGHTCAVTRAGAVKCWGWNDDGQLGDGTRTNRATPVQVIGLESGVRGVAVGSVSTCALTNFGAVKCWGSNRDGTLGNGSPENLSTVPVQVRGLESGARWLDVGMSHACAVTSGGGLSCWGGNFDGELGDGTETTRRTPVQVVGLTSGVARVAAGAGSTCAALASGAARCWGYNYNGQVGDGTRTNCHVPVAVENLTSGVATITVGNSHACVVLDDGAALCWGANYDGELGDGSGIQRRLVPTQVRHGESGVAGINGGFASTCMTRTNGSVRCFGSGSSGELGYGGRKDRRTPVTVKGLTSGMSSVTVGDYHACAISLAGAMKCWGSNFGGQLGDGTTHDRLTPVDVRG